MDPNTLHKAITLAFTSRDRAYAPYSKFRVGASILMEDGTLVGGCNVENASYGAGICAERTAITKAISEGHSRVQAVIVTSDLPTPTISPCGICRQVIREFAPLSAPVYMVAAGYHEKYGQQDTAPAFLVANDGEAFAVAQDKDMVCTMTLDELLPMSFGPEHLVR
ncbi:uncharacterized protein EHS24_006816 [Apiotrichum porosum]|uniref:Cytidine deaminase n=1 Tax=Apiotrichum porosum TaxID=105984 RepID=A0A427XWH6_9TREE|nr:uncharacterized protein EHS24_006816 [Apiotrichum porosum]RSH83157.1 hypothetical protein EHS24_006816 [Apiotrichum porosum]